MLHAYMTPNVMYDFSRGSHSSVFQLSRLNHSLQNAANERGSLYPSITTVYTIISPLDAACYDPNTLSLINTKVTTTETNSYRISRYYLCNMKEWMPTGILLAPVFFCGFGYCMLLCMTNCPAQETTTLL